MSDFHNPYNFIPTMPPEVAPPGTPSHELGLRQGPPASHDRYHEGLWSGRIGIEIETVTPLLVPEARPVREIPVGGGQTHKVYRTRRGPDGKPLLPVTTLKGALRSAYEAVTNSRLGVFRGHGDRLALRMPPGEGLQLIPARIIGTSSGLEAEILRGSNLNWPAWNNGRWDVGGPLYAAWLPYRRATSLPNNSYRFRNGADVTARLELVSRHPFDFWEVVSIVPGHNMFTLLDPNARSLATGHYHPTGTTIDVNGYVFCSRDNIERKHDERLFFIGPSASPAMSLPIAPHVHDAWRELILDYKRIFRRDGPRQPTPGGRPTQTSHHIDVKDTETLRPGTLCYVRLLRNANRALRYEPGTTRPIIDAVFPVTISRELNPASPSSLVPNGLMPANTIERLSPADRVFGWVRQSDDIVRNPQGHAGWKGQLRVHPILCTHEPSGPAFTGTVPLAILSAPKPEQARFYVGCADTELGVTPQATGISRQQAAYTNARRLRGRKVYPHHAAASDVTGYWSWQAAVADSRNAGPLTPAQSGTRPLYREYIRRSEQPNTPKQDGQNRSIQDWIKPGTKFRTHIDVINLNAAEIGALLWLLDLAYFMPDDDGCAGAFFHRIGGGKPLGFGSLQIRISSLDVRDGESRRTEYGSLASILPNTAFIADGDAEAQDAQEALGVAKQFVAVFRRKTVDARGVDFESVPYIQAFLASARGHGDGLQTHYPRLETAPTAMGENYRWFMQNDNGRRAEAGQPRRDGRRLSLPALVDGDDNEDPGLPRSPLA